MMCIVLGLGCSEKHVLSNRLFYFRTIPSVTQWKNQVVRYSFILYLFRSISLLILKIKGSHYSTDHSLASAEAVDRNNVNASRRGTDALVLYSLIVCV